MTKKTVSKTAAKGVSPFLIGAVVLVLVVVAGAVWFSGILTPPVSDSDVLPGQFLNRSQYFEEAFRPDRDQYGIFEAASAFTGKPVSQMSGYFGLQDEADIFAALPPVPQDFSEIAFLLATGKFFALNGLAEPYYLQPEFYPNFKDGGLRWWKQPDPSSWGTNGYGTYPAEQWTTLITGETEQFEATFFLYSGFGVQTYQGVTVFADAPSLEHFDLSVSPDTFLLEPSFPKFHSGWAKKIVVTGRLKEGTPAGDYVVALNIGTPPQDKVAQWQLKYRNLYENAATGVRPSGNQVELHIKVQ